MADIRIKDLATTATTTASDDFMAVDGVTNGTRKLSAATPAFLTSVTTPSLTSPAATNLTLGLGTGGTALTLASSTLVATFAGAVTVGGTVSVPSGNDTTAPSILFPSAGGPIGFSNTSNNLYFTSAGARVGGFGTAGLFVSTNGSVSAPTLVTDAAGASGFFAPANGSIAYSGGGTERFRIAASTGAATFAGAVTMAAWPIIGNDGNATYILQSAATIAAYTAGTSVGTLTNAPSAGDPTKWITINDNGTLRRIPTWTP